VAVVAGEEADPPGDALRPEVAYALVEELVERRADAQLSRLAQSKHKTVCKAARTGLHRLRSHKVEVDVPPSAEEAHEGTGLAAQQALRSMVTVYDSRWERLVWLGDEAPSGVRVFQARISALHGLLDLQSGTTTRKELRAKTRQILDDLGGELVDGDYARWFIHEAARRCKHSGRSQPRGYVVASQALGPDPGGPHPALEITPGPSEPEQLLPLYDLPELRFWHPDREFLHGLALRMDEASTSRLVLTDVQQRQRLADIMERSVGDFFTEPRCQACRGLLLDTAFILSQRGAVETAVALRSAAEIFAASPEQVSINAFARYLVERVVRRVIEAHDHDHDHDHGHAHDHDHDDDSETSSEGGLILP
jgi:hypothetical protein